MKFVKFLVCIGALAALSACSHNDDQPATADFAHEAGACPNWSGRFHHGQYESITAQTRTRRDGVDFNDGHNDWIVDGRRHRLNNLDYRAICHDRRIYVDTYRDGHRIGRTRYHMTNRGQFARGNELWD